MGFFGGLLKGVLGDSAGDAQKMAARAMPGQQGAPMGGLLGMLMGGGNFATQQDPWNPAAGLYNGGMGAKYQGGPPSLLGGQGGNSMGAGMFGARPKTQMPVAPGGDTSNPNPDYSPMPSQGGSSGGFFNVLGKSVMPNTMSSMGKGGGV